VLFATTLVVLILFAGLVVDGGFAFSEQRNTQNGADSAAKAGALVLAGMAAGAPTPASGWDEAVRE